MATSTPLMPHPSPQDTAQTASTDPARAYVITDAEGVDSAEHWAESLEGKLYGVEVSYIHLSTTRVDVGPPLHQHPYVEMIMILRGKARLTVGTRQVVGRAGQTFVIPANTSHTFRTLGPGRYESIATHLSGEFISELLEPDNMFQ